jgi:hypothetical protein
MGKIRIINFILIIFTGFVGIFGEVIPPFTKIKMELGKNVFIVG